MSERPEAEIEDVLTSIRRLVSGEQAVSSSNLAYAAEPEDMDSYPEPDAGGDDSGMLVLTEDSRVPEAVEEGAEALTDEDSLVSDLPSDTDAPVDAEVAWPDDMTTDDAQASLEARLGAMRAQWETDAAEETIVPVDPDADLLEDEEPPRDHLENEGLPQDQDDGFGEEAPMLELGDVDETDADYEALHAPESPEGVAELDLDDPAETFSEDAILEQVDMPQDYEIGTADDTVLSDAQFDEEIVGPAVTPNRRQGFAPQADLHPGGERSGRDGKPSFDVDRRPIWSRVQPAIEQVVRDSLHEMPPIPPAAKTADAPHQDQALQDSADETPVDSDPNGDWPDLTEAKEHPEPARKRGYDAVGPEMDNDFTENLFGPETGFESAEVRAMVVKIVHEELQGALGERITRNVRKLVRREIQRALSSRDVD